MYMLFFLDYSSLSEEIVGLYTFLAGREKSKSKERFFSQMLRLLWFNYNKVDGPGLG
jgi:hypothetical protein